MKDLWGSVYICKNVSRCRHGLYKCLLNLLPRVNDMKLSRWIFFVDVTLPFVLSNLILWSSSVVTEEGNGTTASSLPRPFCSHGQHVSKRWRSFDACVGLLEFDEISAGWRSTSVPPLFRREKTQKHTPFSLYCLHSVICFNILWTLTVKMQSWVHATMSGVTASV